MYVLEFINEYVASPALVLFMVISGSFFTVRQRLFTPKKLRYIFSELKNGKRSDGISPLSSLSVALAGTLGVGNVSGVAVAISVGGAGAVFWMAVSALLGAALKYCEAYLTVKTRKDGKKGGAPYYIEKICGRSAGCVYASFCVVMSVISGSFVQMNAAGAALDMTYGVPKLACGAVFAVLCAVIVLGGSRRVSAFTSAFMPLFCAVFAALSVIAVSMKITEVPAVFARILREAFGFSQVTGGFSGAVISSALRQGMTKGVFSHEAGCGTSSFSHAVSSAESPDAQGAVGIAEALADTLVFGTLTALVILLSPSGQTSGSYDGASFAISAYAYFFGAPAAHILSCLTVFFAFAAVICQSYYGGAAVAYLTSNDRARIPFYIIYCASLTLGAVVSPSFVWHASDIVCAVMLFINCGCMIAGRRLIKNTR